MAITTRGRAASAGLLAAAGLLALAACGSGSGNGSGSGSHPASPSASPSAPAASGAASGGVHTDSGTSLGTVVVSGKGFTLYRFDKDSTSPPASHCTGACAALWPAEPAADASRVRGVDHKLIGSVTGTGGGKQLTIAGHPVYTYARDARAGDTNGQGVQGTWFAVTPTGGKAAAPAGTGSATPSGGGYGY
jgi:predicted lipoprotein with Yx(FWY)xxD motif